MHSLCLDIAFSPRKAFLPVTVSHRVYTRGTIYGSNAGGQTGANTGGQSYCMIARVRYIAGTGMNLPTPLPPVGWGCQHPWSFLRLVSVVVSHFLVKLLTGWVDWVSF